MTPADIRFAADGMLQSLATWLRVIGYDCLAGHDQFGRALLEQAVADDRVFLTRNTHLQNDWPHALLANAQVVYIAGEMLPDQLREVTEKFCLEWEPFLFTRCVFCNAALERVDKDNVLDRLPPMVAEKEELFWHCGICDRIYWQGSHVVRSVDQLKTWLKQPSDTKRAQP